MKTRIQVLVKKKKKAWIKPGVRTGGQEREEERGGEIEEEFTQVPLKCNIK